MSVRAQRHPFIGWRCGTVLLWMLALLASGSGPSYAQGQVDPRFGHLDLSVVDVTVNAGPVGLEFKRALDVTRQTERGALGSRWRSNWESRAVSTPTSVVIDQLPYPVVFTRVAGTPEYRSASGERVVVQSDGRFVRTLLSGMSETFDAQGRLVERDYRNGNKASVRYGADGRLARIDGPRGGFIVLTTDDQRRIARIETSTGSSVRYGYAGDNLTEVEVNGGATLRYEYDATGALVRIENQRSGAVQFRYDAKGRVVSRAWADGSEERYEYDDAARSVRIVDPASAVNTMSWSEDNRRVEITSALGHRSVIEYDSAGRIAAATGPTGAVVRNSYDALGRTVAIEGPGGQQTRFEYVGDTSRLKTVIQPDGARREFDYDSRGNLTTARVGTQVISALTYHADGSLASVQGWGQPEQRYVYHPDGRLKTVANSLGETTQFEYDKRGNLIRETNPLGGVTVRSYDADGRLLTITDASGRTTRYAADAAGRLSEIIDPAGGAIRYQYDARGRRVAETHPTGLTSRYEYDAAGRLAKIIRPDGRIESVRYDAAGNAIESADGLGRSTTFEFDALGRVTRERRPTGLELRYRYDSLGTVVGIEDSNGVQTQFQRDPSGRLTAVTDPLGATTRYQHDALGNVVASIDPRGHTQSFSYTATGAVATAREPSGDAARYTYDPAGRVTAVQHPSGGVTRVTYDAMGNVLRVTDPLGKQRTYGFDVAGRRTSATDAAGRITRYVFDPHGRLAEKQLPDGKRIAYQYDALGNLVQADDGAFPVRYRYDRLNRLTRVEYAAIGKWVEYEYDAHGLQTKLIDSGRRETRYEYGAHKRLAAIVLPDGKRIGLEYDVWNRPQSVSYPNGITGLWEYNPAGRIARITYRNKEGTIVSGWDYRYDAAGNLIERQDSRGQNSRYDYDPAQQLTEETTPQGAIRYRYGAGGNRAAVNAGSDTIPYRHEGDRLVEAGGEKLTYDASGNLVAREGPAGKTSYTYDALDRLVQVRAPDASETAFGYAPTGERISKRDKDGLRYYLYSGHDLIQEVGESGTPTVTYIHGPGIDRPLAMLRDGRYYFYHADRLGSVSFVTDEQGQTAAAYEYGAFGKLSTARSSVPNPFTFTGREWDASTGLYYFRARYYDAGLGRFISADPLPARLGDPLPLNPYLYVRNNPLRFVDPLGLEETWPTGVGAGWENMTSPDLPPAPRPGNPGLEYDIYWEYQYWKAVAARGGAHAEEAAQAAQNLRQQMIDADVPFEPRVGTKPTARGGGDTVGGGGRQPGTTFRGTAPNQATLAGDGPARAPIPEGQTIRMSPNQPRVLPLRGGVSTGFIPAPPQVTVTGVAGGVGTVVGVGAVGVDYQACIDEGRGPEACKQELTDKLPWMAGFTVIGGVLMFTPAAPFVAVGGAALALWGLNNAGNRWANAEEVKALHAALVNRVQNMERRVARLEKQHAEMVSARNKAANTAREAKTFADAAASNLATARSLASQLGNAAGACKNADALAQQITTLASDIERNLSMLKTGLPAAAGMVAACNKKEDVEWVKNLYETGKGVVAEMTVKAQQAESRNDALKKIQAAAQGADTALAQAREAVERIAGNVQIAEGSARTAAEAATTAGSLANQLPSEAAVLRGEIDGFPPAVVRSVVEGWRGRLSAIAAIPADVQDVNAFVAPAVAEATRAKDLLSQGNALLAGLPSAPVCGAVPTADDAAARALAAVSDATLEMYLASDLPSRADVCLASLARTLVALHVQCPSRAYVGDSVTCSATGVYSDNTSKAEDLTPGPWDGGPVFTSQTPGPVTVRVSRANLSDAATVLFEPRPAEPKPPSQPPDYNPFGDPNYKPPGTPTQVGAGKPPGSGVQPPPPPPDAPAGAGEPPRQLGGGAKPQPGTYAGATPSGVGGPPTATGAAPPMCWSDELQTYYAVPMYPCPPTRTKPTSSPPLWTGLKPPPRGPGHTPGTTTSGTGTPGTIPPGTTPGTTTPGSTPPSTASSTPAAPATKPPAAGPTAATKPASPPPMGATCGPATSCTCPGGGRGHIPCDPDKGSCHCGGG